MTLPTRVGTVVVGAGHAGLVMSSILRGAGRDHVVLDGRLRPGGGWQDRWDAFRLVTPNWTASFPGRPYDGDDPHGFMTRDEIVARVAGYADIIEAPMVLGAEVGWLTTLGDGFRIESRQGEVRAREVVVATGSYHRPVRPVVADSLPQRLTQLHSDAYRNEASLPSGTVLVVGSGQSGVQIAEELMDAGRTVLLSVGTAGRIPRRYRGRDIFAWLAALASQGSEFGVPLPTVDSLPDPRLRFAGSPQLSGHHGGHDVDLRAMAESGLTLLGRIERIEGERLALAPDLHANLARADGSFDARLRPLIDRYVERAGIDAPADDRHASAFVPQPPATVDLAGHGVSSVIWATGYRPDFGWIALPIFDEQGFPRHRRGVTDVPGLSFLGLHWQHTLASATLGGVGLDAAYLAERMGIRLGDRLAPIAPSN